MKEKLILIIILFISLNSCDSLSQKDRMQIEENGFESVFAIPDSILTNEQKKLKIKLVNAFFEYSEVKEKKIILTIDREQFVNIGLPTEYYDIFMKDINDVNHYNDSLGIDVADTFLSGKKEFLK